MQLRGMTALAAISLVPLAAAPAAASVKAGIEAWQRGDAAEAITVWRGLAEKGDSDAAFNLGQAYRLGRGVAADSGQAKKWFERAAKAGHLDAQVSLGLLLFDSGSRRQGLAWLGRAAERGEARALLVVGTALFNGDDLPQDPVKGYAYVSRAAAQGLPPAKETLAEMDKVLPLAQRQRGVAMAQEAARAGKPVAMANSTASPNPKAASAAPAPTRASGSASASARGVWRIQLGAFSSKGNAEALYGKLQGKLGGTQAYYVPVGTMTRLQVGPFESRASAGAACARLRPQPCFAVEAR